MADNFQGTDQILLQPFSNDVPYSFAFAACSSAIANDGSLPYGTTISSHAVVAKDAAGTVCTDELIESTSESDDTVTVNLDYPSDTGAGRYSLVFQLTLSSGVKLEFEFTRIKAEA